MNIPTLTGALEVAFRRWPDRPALLFRGQTTTFAGLAATVAALAGAYRHQLRLERGARIICQLPNSPEKLISAAAAWASAAVYVGADHELTGLELCKYIRLTGANALVYSPVAASQDPFLPLWVVRRHHPDVHLIVAGDDVPAGALALSELMTSVSARQRDESFDGPSPEDIAAIFTTSGTTGTPKMPLGYHGNLHRSWVRLSNQLAFSPQDIHLVQLPLAHGFGLMLAMAGLVAGGKLVLVERFSVDETLRLIEDEGITVLNGSPTHFRLLLDRLARRPSDISTLRIGVASGAGFSPALLRSIFDELQMNLMLMYGSSEGVGVVSTDREEMLAGSVGKPVPGSVAIVGPDRKAVSVGEVGEIAFSRKVFPVRYWGQAVDGSPSRAEELVSTGWYYSGDLGRLDAEGRLYVVGRVKHRINRGGMMIDPVEVEEALLQCSGVADAAVLPAPDPVLGEIVCACIVPQEGVAPTLEEIRSALSGSLTRYKLPEELHVLERIPRTGLGKVDLESLRARIEARQI